MKSGVRDHTVILHITLGHIIAGVYAEPQKCIFTVPKLLNNSRPLLLSTYGNKLINFSLFILWSLRELSRHN